MASVGDELRRRVYGAADPTKEQIQTVREAAYEAPAWTQGKSKGISSAAQGGESAGDELRRRVYGGTAAPTSKGYSASGIVSRVGQTGAVTSAQAEDKMPTLAGRIKKYRLRRAQEHRSRVFQCGRRAAGRGQGNGHPQQHGNQKGVSGGGKCCPLSGDALPGNIG